MDLSFDALAARAGATVIFTTSQGPVEATLESATPHGPGGTVVLAGPAEQPLDQGTYPVTLDDLDGLLFVVPVAEADGVRRYAAVFG